MASLGLGFAVIAVCAAHIHATSVSMTCTSKLEGLPDESCQTSCLAIPTNCPATNCTCLVRTAYPVVDALSGFGTGSVPIPLGGIRTVPQGTSFVFFPTDTPQHPGLISVTPVSPTFDFGDSGERLRRLEGESFGAKYGGAEITYLPTRATCSEASWHSAGQCCAAAFEECPCDAPLTSVSAFLADSGLFHMATCRDDLGVADGWYELEDCAEAVGNYGCDADLHEVWSSELYRYPVGSLVKQFCPRSCSRAMVAELTADCIQCVP